MRPLSAPAYRPHHRWSRHANATPPARSEWAGTAAAAQPPPEICPDYPVGTGQGRVASHAHRRHRFPLRAACVKLNARRGQAGPTGQDPRGPDPAPVGRTGRWQSIIRIAATCSGRGPPSRRSARPRSEDRPASRLLEQARTEGPHSGRGSTPSSAGPSTPARFPASWRWPRPSRASSTRARSGRATFRRARR